MQITVFSLYIVFSVQTGIKNKDINKKYSEKVYPYMAALDL